MTPKSATTAGFPAGRVRRCGVGRHLHPVPSMRHPGESLAAEFAQPVAASGRSTAAGYPSPGDGAINQAPVTILVAIDDATTPSEPAEERWAGAVLSTRGPSLRERVAAHGGVEVDAPEGAVAAVFTSPRRALLCSIGLQRTLAGLAAEQPDEPMRVRIALHTGEALPQVVDPLGKLVMLAARIARHARGGEIVVSTALRELVGVEAGVSFGPGRRVAIEGLRDGCALYEICWAGEVGSSEVAGDVFRREGDYWTVSWRGDRCRVRDVRGLHYLAQLLRHPGREFHALDLVGAAGAGMVGAQRSSGMPALDAQAKAAYRRRLDEVREDLEEAEERADGCRAARARAELDALTEQLAAAVGLGGRDRLAAAAAERARCAVTQGIRCALERVRLTLPLLADELRVRVKTGVYCAYLPDPVHPIDWVL